VVEGRSSPLSSKLDGDPPTQSWSIAVRVEDQHRRN